MSRTTKIKLAEQAQRLILAGHPTDDRELSLRELALYVGQAFATIVRQRYFEHKSVGEEHINGDMLFTFDNVAIAWDEAKCLCYSELPSSTMDLPNDMGVNHVSLQKDQVSSFIPVPSQFLSLYSGLSSAFLAGRQGYWVEGDRIYFPNMDESEKECKLLLKLVAAIGGIDEDDDINIPEDMQEAIIKSTVELYSMTRGRKDLASDNIE